MRELSRRRFLEDALLSAAVMATASVERKSLAQPSSATSGRRVGPNDQVRIGVIGFRSRGLDHISSLVRMNDVTVAALCDVDANQAARGIKAVEDAGKKAPVFVQDLRKLLEDPNLDAVSIATPNHWHALAAFWAMQAGKDVYVEKPVSHNVSEGRRLVEASRRYGRICQAGTQSRSAKGVRDAIDWVHSGKIGKVYLARGLCYKRRNSIGKKADAPVPQGVDYDLWLGPAPQRPFNPNRFHYEWHWNWDYGNGDIGNQGIHQMDIARWGLGEKGLPRSVVSAGGRYGYEDDGQTPNTQVSFMDYGDHQLVFEVRGLPTQDLDGALVGNIFYGTDGYVVIGVSALPGVGGQAAFDLDGNVVATFTGGEDHFRNFINAVRSRRREDQTADILEGHLSSALCHLANISYRLGEPRSFRSRRSAFRESDHAEETFARFQEHVGSRVFDAVSASGTDKALAGRLAAAGRSYVLGRRLRVNSRREEFIDDPEANALLARDYREPFVVPKSV